MSFRRFAIYYLPSQPAFADKGAAWLGWDVQRGCTMEQPDLVGLSLVTQTPRRYGFHATLKPPFRLAESADLAGLSRATADLANTLRPARCVGLQLSRMGRFLALTPQGDSAAVKDLAAHCVAQMDRFRAPLNKEDLARRMSPGLSDHHKALLQQWGYPHVMEAFRFHITLTSRLPKTALDHWEAAAQAHFAPLPQPFDLDEIALVGEDAGGRFVQIERFPLGA